MFRVNAFTLHLSSDDRAVEGDDSEVMSALRFDDHQITHLNTLSGSIDIDTFTSILEPDFEQIGKLSLGDSLEPVIIFEFAATPPVCAVQLIVGIACHHTSAAAVKLYIFVIVH